jgi:hypothetical protein
MAGKILTSFWMSLKFILPLSEKYKNSIITSHLSRGNISKKKTMERAADVFLSSTR